MIVPVWLFEILCTPHRCGFRNSEALASMNENLHWYVVYTRPRWEKKIAALLQDKGITHYCPMNKVHRQWSDRMKIVTEPLFKGYVFVQVEERKKWDIKLIDGIVNYVYWQGKPARVRDEEIITIKKFLQEFENVEVTETRLAVNDTVVVTDGIMMDYKGIVLEVSGNKAKVLIQSIGITLSAIFEKKKLIKVDRL